MVTFAGIVICGKRIELKNAFAPILFKLEVGELLNVTEFRYTASLNALSSILVSEDGILIAIKLNILSNVLLPILVHPSPKVRYDNIELLLSIYELYVNVAGVPFT
jgi:hypothetical protein